MYPSFVCQTVSFTTALLFSPFCLVCYCFGALLLYLSSVCFVHVSCAVFLFFTGFLFGSFTYVFRWCSLAGMDAHFSCLSFVSGFLSFCFLSSASVSLQLFLSYVVILFLGYTPYFLVLFLFVQHLCLSYTVVFLVHVPDFDTSVLSGLFILVSSVSSVAFFFFFSVL